MTIYAKEFIKVVFFLHLFKTVSLNEISFPIADNVTIKLDWWFPLCLDPTVPFESFRNLLSDDSFKGCSFVDAASDHLSVVDELLYTKLAFCFYESRLNTAIYFQLTCPDNEIVIKRFDVEIVHPASTKTLEKVKRRRKHKRASNFHDSIVFNQPQYKVNINEEGEGNQVVLNVHASHPDRLPLFYNLIAVQDTRSNSLFHINRTSGQITTTRPLDREIMAKHVFRVTAYEGGGGDPSRSATASIVINVVDINDHAPLFEKSVYVATISESAETGTTVLHVHAQDDDSEQNGEVEYSIVEGDDRGEFAVDSKSGVIKIRRILDREVTDFYRLKVRACDKALKSAKCSLALVEITVEDENDNSPQFTQSKFTVDVPENTDSSKKPVIAKITASDVDAADNAKIHYSIVSGNVANRFFIDYHTGDVRLLEKLNYKQNAQYELVVRAQDSGSVSMSNTTLLIINVQDVNDNAPRFYTTQFQETVREDVPVGYNVVRLQAYDADNGLNAEIRYSLMSNEFDPSRRNNFPLTVDPISGWVSVSKPLDRENDSLFDFYVLATDRGAPPLSSSVRVLVSVSDVNDNAPTFDKKFYNVSVLENTPRGTEVLRVHAEDRDTDSTHLDYSISAGNEEHTFVLLNQGDSGLLTVNDKLDYKTRAIYTITVKAIDPGGYYDTALVYIYVVDVNSPPFFVRDRFQMPVVENLPVNSTVDIVQATDNDDGNNALLTYTLDGGFDYFQIDNRTGLISVVKLLDREVVPKFNLHITARDNGQPPLMAATELEIIVEDVNDNAPIFQHSNYTTSISEDLAVGTSFMSITATDYDIGANGRISYFFTPENAYNDSFYIDATSGTIRVNKPLDREETPEYFLTVIAIDKGSPPLTGTTNVHIVLNDVNDNPPKFNADVYRFYIPENSPIGTKIARIKAVDPDSGSNSAVSYKIFGGPDMALFELSSPVNGGGVDIISRSEFDYEAHKNLYQFQVQASSGDLSSVVEIHVQVQDINDHAPQLEDFYLIFNNYPDYFPLAAPGMIPAHDADVNDSLTYWVDAGNEANLLSVDSDTGQMFLSPNLNTNRQIDAQMRICVSDGVNKVCATCTLRATLITEEVLLNSITVRAKDATVYSFLSPDAYTRFVNAITMLLPSNRGDVIVFSVRSDGILQGESVLNISLSVKRPNREQFVGAGELQELVHLNRETISTMAQIDLLPFEDNLCVREPCLNFERCQNVLKFGEATNFITTKNFLFRPIHPVNTFVCVCPEGFAGMSKQYMCDVELNLCYSSPCGPNATCVSKEGGYTCQCLPNYAGPRCEFSLTTDFCIPGLCGGASKCDVKSGDMKCVGCQYSSEFTTNYCQLTARSFHKNSHITFPPLNQRYRFELQLSFVTTDADGILFYNGRYHPEHDFISLLMNDGKLKLFISVGGSEIVRLILPEENIVNDGRWHTTVTMSFDVCDEMIALRHSEEINYPKCAVQTTIPLDNRCVDPTVSCYRFLDLSGPLYVGGLPQGIRAQQFRVKGVSFTGCMKEFFIDNEMVDFGKYVINHGTEPGCKHLRDDCVNRPCVHSKRCTNVWNGYHCDCNEGYGGKNCSDEIGPSLSLKSEDSYVNYEVPANFPMPFVFGISFKTRQRTATLLTADFTGKRSISLKIWNDKPRVTYGGDLFTMAYPNVGDGQWHSISITVTDTHLNFTVDDVYTSTFTLSETFYGGLTKIYVGVAIGANFAQPFTGCVKGAFLSRSVTRSQYLRLENQVKVESGCHSLDPCHSNTCPKNSVCVQNWDTYICKCLPGFVGAKCIDSCSLHLCKNGGRCRRSVTGYDCQCPKGFYGKYCQYRQILAGDQCPKNWWGQPLCGPCKCNVNKGFDPDCNKTTGSCSCKNQHYKPPLSDTCLPCHCFYPQGSASLTCDPVTGQCPCKGNAQGRRCNTCFDLKAQINQSTGYCEVIEGYCPENFAAEVLWRETAFGSTAVQSCPDGASGYATRFCSSDSLWSEPNLFNCTSKVYEPLNSLLIKLDNELEFSPYLAKRTALQLKNVSNEVNSLYGRDMYISYRLLMMLLRNELNNGNGAQFNHLQDKRFVENIITTTSVIFDPVNIRWWLVTMDNPQEAAGHLIQTIHEFGRVVAQSLQTMHIRPFRVATKNIVFAVDTLRNTGQRIVLPKFDNFLYSDDAEGVSIELPIVENNNPNSVSVAFYATFKTVDQLMSVGMEEKTFGPQMTINTPVLSLLFFNSSNSIIKTFTEPILVRFSLRRVPNSSNPQCVWWDQSGSSKGIWRTDGCHFLWRNESHVICACNHLSVLAVMMEVGDYAFAEVTDTVLPYFAITCATLSIGLLTGCLFVQCCPTGIRHSNTQSIFKSICIAYMFVILAFLFVTRAKHIDVACKLLNSMLQYFYLSLFLWLLLGPVHLYRIITEIRDVEHGSSWIYCLVGWGVSGLFTCLSAVLNFRLEGNNFFCWTSLNNPYIWLMICPISLSVLLTLYMSGLCAIIGYSKEWDLLSSKLNFRSELFTATLTELACIGVWLLALLSVNLQRLELHYCYHVWSLVTAVLIAYLVCHEGNKFNQNVKKAYFWITKEIPEEMTTSKSVGGVSGEDPSATVSRPESPVVRTCADYLPPIYSRDDCDEEDEDANETTLLSAVSRTATINSESAYFINRESGFHSTNDLNRTTVRPATFHTLKAKSSDYNRSKPDLIPSWEQNLAITSPDNVGLQNSDLTTPVPSSYMTYAGSRYGRYRRQPFVASNLNRGILSPVQKVLSGNESSVSTSVNESPSKLVTFTSSPRRLLPKNERDFETHDLSSRTLPQKCFTADELSCFHGSNLNDRALSRDSVI